MEAGSAWPLLVGGLGCAIAGSWLLVQPDRLAALTGALGSGAPGRRERTWVPLALLAGGAAWIVTFLGDVLYAPDEQRPYLLVIVLVAAPLIGAVAVVGTAVWLAVLRRLG